MARIAVVGVGAIGAVVAAALGESGRHELVACVRGGVDGIDVEGPSGTARLDGPFLRIEDLAAPREPVDWILLATKAYDLATAAPWFAALGGARTRTAVLQNGIDAPQRLVAMTHRGRRGHPVGFGSAWGEQLAALTGDTGARSLLAGQDIRLIDWPDDSVLRDIDRPADLDRTQAGPRRGAAA